MVECRASVPSAVLDVRSGVVASVPLAVLDVWSGVVASVPSAVLDVRSGVVASVRSAVLDVWSGVGLVSDQRYWMYGRVFWLVSVAAASLMQVFQ